MPQQAPAAPRFTYGDYRRWHGDERWELMDGEARAMSPAPSRLHQQVLTRLAAQIVHALEDGPCEVYVAPFDVRLPRGDEPDDEIETVLQRVLRHSGYCIVALDVHRQEAASFIRRVLRHPELR